jgi:hypothetical protein
LFSELPAALDAGMELDLSDANISGKG